MEKKAVLALFLLGILFSIGCSAEKKNDKPIFFKPETCFHIGFKSENNETKAKLFFDEKGHLHLLHEDTSSPLFGLEEIFSREGVKSHFYDLEFQNALYYGGTATVYRAIEAIKNEESISRETKQGITTYVYEGKQLNFSFLYDENTKAPLRIFGKENGVEFDINFCAFA